MVYQGLYNTVTKPLVEVLTRTDVPGQTERQTHRRHTFINMTYVKQTNKQTEHKHKHLFSEYVLTLDLQFMYI